MKSSQKINNVKAQNMEVGKELMQVKDPITMKSAGVSSTTRLDNKLEF